MPEDEAIPAPEVPATNSFTRDFVLDKQLLQREAKTDVPSYLWTLAYLVVALITTVTIAGIGRGLHVAGTTRPDTDAVAPYGPDRKKRVQV
jgi:hypothetical protein